jgi:hypothetical protein
MAASPALIKQADLARIAKAMQAAGVEEWRAEIDPSSGKVAIVARKSTPPLSKSDWD